MLWCDVMCWTTLRDATASPQRTKRWAEVRLGGDMLWQDPSSFVASHVFCPRLLSCVHVAYPNHKMEGNDDQVNDDHSMPILHQSINQPTNQGDKTGHIEQIHHSHNSTGSGTATATTPTMTETDDEIMQRLLQETESKLQQLESKVAHMSKAHEKMERSMAMTDRRYRSILRVGQCNNDTEQAVHDDDGDGEEERSDEAVVMRRRNNNNNNSCSQHMLSSIDSVDGDIREGEVGVEAIPLSSSTPVQVSSPQSIATPASRMSRVAQQSVTPILRSTQTNTTTAAAVAIAITPNANSNAIVDMNNRLSDTSSVSTQDVVDQFELPSDGEDDANIDSAHTHTPTPAHVHVHANAYGVVPSTPPTTPMLAPTPAQIQASTPCPTRRRVIDQWHSPATTGDDSDIQRPLPRRVTIGSDTPIRIHKQSQTRRPTKRRRSSISHKRKRRRSMSNLDTFSPVRKKWRRMIRDNRLQSIWFWMEELSIWMYLCVCVCVCVWTCTGVCSLCPCQGLASRRNRVE